MGGHPAFDPGGRRRGGGEPRSGHRRGLAPRALGPPAARPRPGLRHVAPRAAAGRDGLPALVRARTQSAARRGLARLHRGPYRLHDDGLRDRGGGRRLSAARRGDPALDARRRSPARAGLPQPRPRTPRHVLPRDASALAPGRRLGVRPRLRPGARRVRGDDRAGGQRRRRDAHDPGRGLHAPQRARRRSGGDAPRRRERRARPRQRCSSRSGSPPAREAPDAEPRALASLLRFHARARARESRPRPRHLRRVGEREDDAAPRDRRPLPPGEGPHLGRRARRLRAARRRLDSPGAAAPRPRDPGSAVIPAPQRARQSRLRAGRGRTARRAGGPPHPRGPAHRAAARAPHREPLRRRAAARRDRPRAARRSEPAAARRADERPRRGALARRARAPDAGEADARRSRWSS